jgi:hypothetical protein
MEIAQERQTPYSVPSLLRYLGGAVLLASGATYLFEGWAAFSSLQRYLTFFAFTALLAVAGLVCSRVLKEQKGARLFMAFATAAVPALVSQLGAMLYEGVGVGGASPLLIVASILCCGVLVLLGFSVLHRSQAAWATPLFLASSGLLLVPTRDNAIVPWLILASAGLVVFAERLLARRPESRTAEGIALRLILAIPTVILAVRSALYPGTDFLAATLCLLLAWLLFATPRMVPGPFAELVHGMSAGPLVAGWIHFSGAIPWQTDEGASFALRWFAIPWVLLIASLRSEKHGRWFRLLAAASSVGAGIFGLSLYASPWTSVACAATGIVLAAAGTHTKHRALLLVGLADVAMALVTHVALLSFLWRTPWLSLAGLGMAVVVAASLIERYQTRLARRWASLRTELATWQ